MVREERQKAIDALKISAPVMAVTQEEFNDYIQTLNQVIDWLEQEPKWIPVSECVPKKYSYVLLSTDAEEIFIACYLGKMSDGTDCFDDDDSMMWEGNIIAWMPLPKPYEPQESDHKCHTCHTCKHYTSGERDGSCGSYICKHYSDWESEEV